VDLATFLPFWGATSLYGLAFLLYIAWFRQAQAGLGQAATSALGLGVTVHLMGLVRLGLERGFWPPTNLGETLSLVSLATAVLYLYVELRSDERGLGVFAMGPVLALMSKASLIGPALVVPRELRQVLFGPHAAAIILALSGFTISAFLSLAYLMVYRQLRNKRLGVLLQRLPSLQTLDQMARRATRMGFVLLTLGAVLGAVLAKQAWGVAWSWDPKQCMTLLTWLLYAAAIVLRRWRAWQGGRVAAANLVAFSSVLIGAYLLYAVLETKHRFG
jgi:ABC-type transport system involved in cytochrome c biogenesis permease subunit